MARAVSAKQKLHLAKIDNGIVAEVPPKERVIKHGRACLTHCTVASVLWPHAVCSIMLCSFRGNASGHW